LLLGLTGCPNPIGEFEEFEERYAELHPPTTSSVTTGGGACSVPVAGEIDGHYMFALSAQIRPDLPVLYDAQVTTADGANGLTLSMTIDPLDARDRMTPLGVPQDYGPFDVDATSGAFTVDFGELTIPGKGNPVILDTDIVGTVTAIGTLCTPFEILCGAIEGQITAPSEIDLKDSTFTIEAVPDGGSYPDPPKIDCAGTLAGPAPTD
jgi:hypothetical protein